MDFKWWEWIAIPFVALFILGWMFLALLGIVKHPADIPDFLDSVDDWEPDEDKDEE